MNIHQKVAKLLSTVTDPEIPVLTIEDLGILRKFEILESGRVVVTITPTYSGCPAMDMIGVNVRSVLQEEGIDDVEIKLVLSPAWTTDWMTESGKKKLKEYGIAAPLSPSADKLALLGDSNILECPQCHSKNTTLLSQFASTSCKAMFKCGECFEVFDYFKCHR